ncbi:unnamed protein product [Allacma fusca]|uniref:Uncharacterized protein n=1 Tax=Allacma fusca TaxID=39272 RepID=A0A8J2P6C7_9HEXA|nr:unnamed protein product [Allacma fusca]
MNGLNGKRILERNISVRYAHQASFVYTDEEEKLRKKLPALGMKMESEAPVSKERTINAIEAKLRAMERDKDEQNDFSLTSVGVNKNKAVTTRTSAIIHYPYAKASSHHHSYDVRTRSKPYSRNYPKKRY